MEASNLDEEPFVPPTRREALIPVISVSAVAIVAVATAVMVRRADHTEPAPQPVATLEAPLKNADVVKAPPLEPPATNSMGSSRACETCGVVEAVVAVYAQDGKAPRAFQMHIRMDDGSTRTVEQRGALPAGSRVTVERGAVRPM